MERSDQGVYGPAADLDASKAYLFLCIENGRYGVSNDVAGRNLPHDDCLSGWKLISEFVLGVKEVLPLAADPEPILAALRADGFYVFPEGRSPAPFGELD
jgi:hypothetical protein